MVVATMNPQEAPVYSMNQHHQQQQQQQHEPPEDQPKSLETSASSSCSLNSGSFGGDDEQQQQQQQEAAPVMQVVCEDDNQQDEQEPPPEASKCSAVHALERDMPQCDYSQLVAQLRELILDHHHQNEGLYNERDIQMCKTDDWHLARFLLRHKLDLEAAFQMLKATLRWKNESLYSQLRAEDFPREFYQLGGCFLYEPDRKNNQLLYLRVRVHRKTPEIAAVVHAFLAFQVMQCDLVARGRGMSLVIDCSGAGLQSADMDMLYYLIWMLKNYFPKGLSYILVHNLPWLLKPFWHLAKVWVPEEHKELIKFSNQKTIYEFVTRENLPDFMGGTCNRDYRRLPNNCTTIAEAVKLWGIDKRIGWKLLEKFEENLPAESVAQAREFLSSGGGGGGGGHEHEQIGSQSMDFFQKRQDTDDSGNDDDDDQSYHSSNEDSEQDVKTKPSRVAGGH